MKDITLQGAALIIASRNDAEIGALMHLKYAIRNRWASRYALSWEICTQSKPNGRHSSSILDLERWLDPGPRLNAGYHFPYASFISY